MLCAVALSSSISRTRMSGPQPCPRFQTKVFVRQNHAAKKPSRRPERYRSIQYAKVTANG
jgi:hypothetical protein